jgi:hypothetical protein
VRHACATAIALRPAIQIAMESFGELATRLRRRERRRPDAAERGLGTVASLAAIGRQPNVSLQPTGAMWSRWVVRLAERSHV